MVESVYNLEIFKWIERDVIENILLNSLDRKYLAWEMIITEWENSNGEWYIIKHGKVSISIKWSKIAELNSWDIFWEIALLNEEERTASVVALTDIEVIVLTYDNLIDMINNDANKINKTIMNRIEENLNRE
jgi:CRP-like cAMP-binding protein